MSKFKQIQGWDDFNNIWIPWLTNHNCKEHSRGFCVDEEDGEILYTIVGPNDDWYLDFTFDPESQAKIITFHMHMFDCDVQIDAQVKMPIDIPKLLGDIRKSLLDVYTGISQ